MLLSLGWYMVSTSTVDTTWCDVCVQIQSFNGSYAYAGITLDQRDNYIQWKHKVNDSHAITGQEIHATFTTNPNNFATNTIQIITKTPN